MVQSGLVGWWPLHEWSGRTNDLSGNDLHSTSNNPGASGIASIGGLTAKSFNGTDQYISFGNPSELDIGTSDFTISAWINISGSADRNGIFVRGDNTAGNDATDISYALYANNQSIRIRTHDSNANGSPVFGDTHIPHNEWVHVVGMKRGGKGLLYVNGELDAVGDLVTPDTTAAAVYIGANPDGAKWWFDGNIADVRFYNRALNESEIDHLHKSGSLDLAIPPTGDDPNAVSRYSFDDRSDTGTALDEWGVNSGAINGAVYSGDSVRDGSLSMSFDGSNDWIDTGGELVGSGGPLTISGWFKWDGSADFEYIYSQGHSGSKTSWIALQVEQNNNQIRFFMEDDAGTTSRLLSNKVVNDGSWHHATATVDSSGNTKLYHNGIVVDSGTTPGGTFNNTDQSAIGVLRRDNFDGYWTGNLDDVRVYSRALDESETYQLYRYGSPGVDLRSEVINL